MDKEKIDFYDFTKFSGNGFLALCTLCSLLLLSITPVTFNWYLATWIVIVSVFFVCSSLVWCSEKYLDTGETGG